MTDNNGGYNRPRRPEPETISYLRGLPLDITAAKKEIDEFLNSNDGEYPQSLAAALSAITEIRNEVASLAGDEHGSQCLEILAHIAAPYSELASRTLLAACQGYHLHMATHRYCSHVVQTLIQLSVQNMSKDCDMALHEDGPQCLSDDDGLPSLSALILGIVEELTPNAQQLAIHVCGSHVLRTLLCVLGRVDLVSSRGSGASSNVSDYGAALRGRKKNKKKKKKAGPEGTTESAHPGTMDIVYPSDSRLASSDIDMTSSLEQLTRAIVGESSGGGPGELQQLTIHPSAGPLLIVLLRVLTYSAESARREFDHQTSKSSGDFRLGIAKEEPRFEIGSPAHKLVCALLCWNEDVDEQEHAGEVIYGLSGETRGSHLLETILKLAPDSLHEEIVKCGEFDSASSFQEYAEHDVSNFVIQTILATTRNKENAESILKIVEKSIANGLAVDSQKKRRGILWRAVELAAKFRVGQESILKAIRIGFGSLNKDDSTNNDSNQAAQDGKTKKKRAKTSALDIKSCIPMLIGLQKPEQDGVRAVMDVAGCRTVYHLLRFAPRLCEETLEGILEGLTTDELVVIAKDGLGSRCIMDGILEGPVQTPIFAAAAKKLLKKFTGTLVALSSDRVGHHIVMKLFHALPKIDDKTKLVDELATSGGNRLSGTSMGRSVMEACRVEEYQESAKHWRHTIANTLQHHKSDGSVDILKDVIPSKSGGGGGGGGGGEDKASSKSKRKRKRKRPDKSHDDDTEEKVRKIKSKPLSVDAIVNAIGGHT